MMTTSVVEAISPSASRKNKATILLVEDEFDVRQVTREVLEYAGYRVLECSGPEEALRCAGDCASGIAMLLSDVVMPGMTGPDLAQQLRAQHPGLITVFMSGYAGFDALQKIKGGESATYIQKPFTMSVLLARVAEALGRGAANSTAGSSSFSI